MGVFRQSSLRALAPASLVLFAIVLLIVVIASLTGGGNSSSSNADRVTVSQPRNSDRASKARRIRRRALRGIYIVRAGDNFSTIAVRTGVPIETLQQLNPTLDPQALVRGQHVRLPVKGESGATGATGSTGNRGSTGASGTAGPG